MYYGALSCKLRRRIRTTLLLASTRKLALVIWASKDALCVRACVWLREREKRERERE